MSKSDNSNSYRMVLLQVSLLLYENDVLPKATCSKLVIFSFIREWLLDFPETIGGTSLMKLESAINFKGAEVS